MNNWRERSRSPSVESNREIESLHSAKQHHQDDAELSLRNSHDESVRYEDLTFDTVLPFEDHKEFPNLKHYESPFKWSATRKNIIMVLSCFATWLAAYSAGSYSISSGPLVAKWGMSSTAFQTGVTAWCVGFACSPMFLAPLSELNGRRPVFLFSGFMFFVAQIGCAVTDSFAGMLVARFFVGAGASTFATMVGGVVSDIFHAEDRNAPMAIYSASALAGTGFGPMVCGFIVTRTSWRWVFWHQVMGLGLLMAAMLIFFKETRGSVLLRRKAEKINKFLDSTQQPPEQQQQHHDPASEKNPTTHLPTRYTLTTDATTTHTLPHLIYLSLTTPFKLLFTEPVVFSFSLWAAFAWGVLYMQLNVLPLVFASVYAFPTEHQGAVFASLIIGALLAVTLSIYQERLAKRLRPKLFTHPEGRLYFACLEAALLPIGLFWFGWSAHPDVHWVVPCMGIACAMMGIFAVYLAVFNYLADVYHRYASSALACQSFCRNILGGVFPLFSQAMFRRLGTPGASSLLGGLAAVLTVVPWVLVFKGESIRARSRVAREVMETHG